jgi:L-alanine-DL-glutamate epimerase-like enolase superfamily enzyme
MGVCRAAVGAGRTLDGSVIVPQTPGLGLEYDWDYINDNLIDE